ncbi:MAG: BrnT family toxin [Alphaproteobacteria bacterium]
MIGFEWDEEKAARNLIEHGVSFEQAALACLDPFAVEWIDERQNYGEERIGLLGLYRREVLFVAYTERGENIRIITARRAERIEQDRYYRENSP